MKWSRFEFRDYSIHQTTDDERMWGYDEMFPVYLIRIGYILIAQIMYEKSGLI